MRDDASRPGTPAAAPAEAPARAADGAAGPAAPAPSAAPEPVTPGAAAEPTTPDAAAEPTTPDAAAETGRTAQLEEQLAALKVVVGWLRDVDFWPEPGAGAPADVDDALQALDAAGFEPDARPATPAAAPTPEDTPDVYVYAGTWARLTDEPGGRYWAPLDGSAPAPVAAARLAHLDGPAALLNAVGYDGAARDDDPAGVLAVVNVALGLDADAPRRRAVARFLDRGQEDLADLARGL
ncbi:hypothetical protein [Corynebacterium sp. 335C]